MKFLNILLFSCLFLAAAAAQTLGNTSIDQSPVDKYLERWLSQSREESTFEMEFSVDGSASFQYGLKFSDEYEASMNQGFLTVIQSSLDLDFTFYPETFSNINANNMKLQGVYAEIVISDFDVVISNDAGIDFWENYRIYDNLGNPYLPSRDADENVISDDPETTSSEEYENTILYTGVGVTAPTVKALLHLTPHFAFQIASQPEIDFNLATTLDGDEWAGVSTENSGGFSLVWEYPLMTMIASAVSQHYYDYSDSDDDDFRQDDEFGFSLDGEILIGDLLRFNTYASYVNYFSSSNGDSFYFATERGDSSVDSLASGGMALTLAFLELAELGISGDMSFVVDGEYDRSDFTDDVIDIYGFLWDARIDAPLFYSTKSALVASAVTNDYSFRSKIFAEEERNKEFPLDLQLSYLFQNEKWDFQTVMLASNFLNYIIEYEDYLLGDYQNLSLGIDGSVILGDSNGLYVSPGLSLGYSLGRITTNGYIWSDDGTAIYVDNWKDDVLGGNLYVQIGFPQTLITLSYENNQLLPNQDHVIYSESLQTRDMGIFTFTTEIFY